MMSSRFSETMDCAESPAESGLISVQAEHPHWTSCLLLDPATQRVLHSVNGSHGTYTFNGEFLEVKWDAFPPDNFILKDGRYLHATLVPEKQPTPSVVFGDVSNSSFKAALRRQGTDIAVYSQVFRLGEHDTRYLPKNASVIVDLGGNVGLASLFFATKYPDALIIALEPDPENFSFLVRNLSQLKDKAGCRQAAIWNEDCHLQLKRTDGLGNPPHDCGGQVSATGNGAAATMKRLIQELGLKRIDILKIDIEGAEKELFEAADLSWLDVVDMIFIEIHERFRPGSHAAVLRILDHGFSMVPNCGENNVFVRTPPERRASDFGATPQSAEAVTGSPRVAIITGYYKEERQLLERCIRSVRQQTITADHILVADGFPQDWIDTRDVRHIRLDRKHSDYGGTPRGIGSLLAIAEEYDAIGFLDADNYLEPNHLELALLAASRVAVCDYVIARRHFRRPDETIINVADEPIDLHVDTNCFLFLPGSFHAVMDFALIPRQLSALGDRIFYSNLKKKNLSSAIMPVKTVNYNCLWASVYAAAGEEPPPDAKPNIDHRPLQTWITRLTPRGRLILNRRTGL
ncbi:MAG TPA: FkbM family methyltransferase [Methylocella sp.]|nr:FkbM family methyltransferase [Methylocella sp.]